MQPRPADRLRPNLALPQGEASEECLWWRTCFAREKRNSHQHTFSERPSVGVRAGSSVYRRRLGSWARGNCNLATFARAATSVPSGANCSFRPTNSNAFKWIELSVDRRTTSFDRVLFEHFGFSSPETIWFSRGAAPSHPRTSHEKDGSFDAGNSGAARRCINFFVCRGWRSAADVFPWELPRKIAALQSKN